MKVKMVCRWCGSENVRRDADVAWDVDQQRWELVAVYDNADCEDCEGETSLLEKEVAE
jgi:hypothetical protein